MWYASAARRTAFEPFSQHLVQAKYVSVSYQVPIHGLGKSIARRIVGLPLRNLKISPQPRFFSFLFQQFIFFREIIFDPIIKNGKPINNSAPPKPGFINKKNPSPPVGGLIIDATISTIPAIDNRPPNITAGGSRGGCFWSLVDSSIEGSYCLSNR